jgi:hypothetical protein
MDGRLDNGHIWRPVSIFAWNEWGEQAVLEPSTLNGFSYLQNLHQARQDAMEMNCTLYLQQNTAFSSDHGDGTRKRRKGGKKGKSL